MWIGIVDHGIPHSIFGPLILMSVLLSGQLSAANNVSVLLVSVLTAYHMMMSEATASRLGLLLRNLLIQDTTWYRPWNRFAWQSRASILTIALQALNVQALPNVAPILV